MKRQAKFIISLSIIAVFTFNIICYGYAQEQSILQLGLDETIKRALDTSEELKIKVQEVNRTQGVYREVRSVGLPQVGAEVSWIHNLDYPDKAASSYSDHQFSAGISASQVLWSFGKIAYAVNAAKKAVEASIFNKEAGKQEIIYSAKLSYYSSLLARNSLAITEKSYANVLENKKILGERTYGGRSPKYEIIRMNAEVAARVPTVNEARTTFDAATETLRKIIDVDLDSKIELAGDFQEKYADFNFETLVVAMNEYEPSLKSFSKTIESAEEKVKSKYASFLPTLSAVASWSYLGGLMSILSWIMMS